LAEPVTAAAATKTFTTKALAAGTTVSGTNGKQQKYTIYKITTPKDGYVTFRNFKADNGELIAIYKSLTAAKKMGNPNAGYVKQYAEKSAVALAKGTYYVLASGSYKFKYSFTAAKIDQSNYCMSKAISLASGKTAKICQTYGNSHGSWYKFTLTSAKKVTFTIKNLRDPGTEPLMWLLFDSNMNPITELENVSGDVYKTTTKLPKGTCYFYFEAYPIAPYVFTFSWK
jgi:hypothetical protein